MTDHAERVREIFDQLDWDNRKRENDTRLEDAIDDLFGWIGELEEHLTSESPAFSLGKIRDELAAVAYRFQEIELP